MIEMDDLFFEQSSCRCSQYIGFERLQDYTYELLSRTSYSENDLIKFQEQLLKLFELKRITGMPVWKIIESFIESVQPENLIKSILQQRIGSSPSRV